MISNYKTSCQKFELDFAYDTIDSVSAKFKHRCIFCQTEFSRGILLFYNQIICDKCKYTIESPRMGRGISQLLYNNTAVFMYLRPKMYLGRNQYRPVDGRYRTMVVHEGVKIDFQTLLNRLNMNISYGIYDS